MRRSPPPHVFVALIVGAIAISVAAILIRWADAPPLVTAAARMTIAAALVGPVGVVRARTEFRKLTLRDLGVAALSGVLLAVHFAAWITSLELTSVASSVVLVTTSPLWAALLGPLLTGDRLTRSMIVGIIFATAGGIVVGMGDFTLSNSALLGDGLALLGAIMAALYLLAGRTLRQKLSVLGYITINYSVAALVLVGLALAAGESFGGYSTQTYLLLVLIAVIPQIFGHSAYNYALAWFSASFIAVAFLAEPVGATLLAAILLDEPVTPPKVVGGALILLGIYLAARSEVSQPPAASDVGTNLVALEEQS